jgi:hypothetical protein
MPLALPFPPALCWHVGGCFGCAKDEKRTKKSTGEEKHERRKARFGARFVYFVFFVLLKSLNPCAVESFFGLGFCMWAFADLVAGLASKAAFFLHRTGFSCWSPFRTLIFTAFSTVGVGYK